MKTNTLVMDVMIMVFVMMRAMLLIDNTSTDKFLDEIKWKEKDLLVTKCQPKII